MLIKDKGIIMAKRLSGEKSGIITIFSEDNGLYAFYAKNVNGKNSVIYQPGNIVDVFLSSKANDSMSQGYCELVYSAFHFMQSKAKLYALSSVFAIILASFEEKMSHPNLYKNLLKYITSSCNSFNIMHYFRLEFEILTEAGYGLDFSTCAVSGQSDLLSYVSPKSGRAVSQAAGEDYKDKLLKLPPCALTGKEPLNIEELMQIADLLLYFFKRYVFKRGQPSARIEFIKYLKTRF